MSSFRNNPKIISVCSDMRHMGLKKATTALKKSESYYSSFDAIDGTHPWQQIVPDGYVPYRVRRLNKGTVTYFNYTLAKEMGLIDSNHPHQMNDDLELKLLETFSLQIINEYDELNNKRIDPTTILPNKYMATRYLQLQHEDKTGKTSGDGRGIWNGHITNKNKHWDISSRGTGVTRLSPGSVFAAKPLETGNESHGYGCGRCEIDELYAQAIMAETMHLQGINTERVLCIIDHGNGYGIGVRAGLNLIRPAHLFLYLKQNKYHDLKNAIDYVIERQVQNGEWEIPLNSSKKYDHMLANIAKSFAQFAAQLEVNYIFAWLDWDGDNVLVNAGIIDYGSIRQFGLRHDQYRYDDVERFSTNLNEQKKKARQIVAVFAQIVDYLKSKQKKSIKYFENSDAAKKFDQYFDYYKKERLLYKLGFNSNQREHILVNHQDLYHKFEHEFSYFETAKVNGPIQKVADGINRPAIFNIKNILRELPKHYVETNQKLTNEAFHKLIVSSFAKAKDTKLGHKQATHIQKFQQYYFDLCQTVLKSKQDWQKFIERSQVLNKKEIITGNGVVEVVGHMLEEFKKGLKREKAQEVIDKMISHYFKIPEVKVSSHYSKFYEPKVSAKLYKELLEIVKSCHEDI